MKFAVIAAGEGSRLAAEGISEPKPLVRLLGEPLIDRLIRIFNCNGAEEIVVIVNDIHPQTEAYMREAIRTGRFANVRLVVKTTPSSMHSFYELKPFLDGGPFCLTTVDTVFCEDEFEAYIRTFCQNGQLDGLMAVTDYVDDEKPLYVAVDADWRITGFHDRCEGDRFVSGGIYCLRPRALDTLERCMREGQSRMRNFQRGLVADGLCLRACLFSKIMDVDHADDIRKAECFLAGE